MRHIGSSVDCFLEWFITLFDLSAKDYVPHLAGDTVSSLGELVVVLHVVRLQVLHVLEVQSSVVKVVMNQVVAQVANQETDCEGMMSFTQDHGEQRLDKAIEDHDSRDRREDQSVPIRRERVVDAVNEEVNHIDAGVLWQILKPVVLSVEKPSVKDILSETPGHKAPGDDHEVLSAVVTHEKALVVEVGWPEDEDAPPGREAGHLKQVAFKQNDVPDRISENLRLIDVLAVALECP